MDSFVVRKAQPADLVTVHECVLALYSELDAYHMPFELNAQRMGDILKAHINSKTSIVLLLEYNGAVSGVLVGHITKLDNRYQPTCGMLVGRITEIYVAPTIRHKNMAQALLNSADEWFKYNSVNYIEADILMDNIASHKFFKKMGFLPLTQRVYKTI